MSHIDTGDVHAGDTDAAPPPPAKPAPTRRPMTIEFGGVRHLLMPVRLPDAETAAAAFEEKSSTESWAATPWRRPCCWRPMA